MDAELTVRTPDGRSIDVFLGGPPDGTPLIFHNGTPSSGRLYAPFVSAAADRGLRMVSFSRAGYGGSTRNPGRSVADVVPDVAAVLDELGADRFHTLGWSGGGPHALACAALLPKRVLAAATVGGLAPRDAEGLDWMAGMGEENVAVFSAALAGEAELVRFLEKVAPSFGAITAHDVAASLNASAPDVDREAIQGDAAAWLADVFRESVRNGIGGWLDDERAFVRPWGFEVVDIAVPVAVWQGALDRNTPLAHGEWLASHIPAARPHLLSDHGHISLGVDSFGLLLDDLLAIAPA
ncbi:MAG TPA: alpha/beta fold hydrolase [Candidatus Limnocylindria bacterium]|nr:alpha/beta fold hydrolase [Candidatus Limnocylindria bacterium]